MTDERVRFGPWAYGHEVSDVFTDVASGAINFDYFQPYFGLSRETAKEQGK